MLDISRHTAAADDLEPEHLFDKTIVRRFIVTI